MVLFQISPPVSSRHGPLLFSIPAVLTDPTYRASACLGADVQAVLDACNASTSSLSTWAKQVVLLLHIPHNLRVFREVLTSLNPPIMNDIYMPSLSLQYWL